VGANKMYLSVQAVREARQEVLDKIEAINTVATDENRELTPDEVKTADELLAQHDKLVESEKTAAKYEAAQMDLVRNSPQNSIGTSSGPGKPSANLTPPPPYQHGNRELRAFRADTRAQSQQDAYDAGMFLVATCTDRDDRDANPRLYQQARQHCQDRGLIRGDAQTLDDDAKGGYLAAHTLQSAIIRIVQEVGISRRICNVVPMPTETLTQPKRSGGLTVYSPTEDAAITASEMSWSNVNLIARDRAVMTKISNKLLRSGTTIASVADQVATEIGYAFAYAEDSALIDGDMTETYFNVSGLEIKLGTAGINTTTTTTQDTWIELVNQNFTDTMALLPGKFWRRHCDAGGWRFSGTSVSRIPGALYRVSANGNCRLDDPCLLRQFLRFRYVGRSCWAEYCTQRSSLLR
jgi:HK97 family phage major capsid protein